MASDTLTVTSAAYQAVTSFDSLIQNVSAYPVRWIADTNLPSENATDYHTLEAGEALIKLGDLPLGTIYMRADIAGRDVKIVFSV